MATPEVSDGLSKLPEHIIQQIFSSLAPIEAAQASVLSKSCWNAWLKRSSLHFDDYHLSHDIKSNFMNCINSTFLRYHEHKPGIHTLELKLFVFSMSVSFIDRWLQIAVENGVKSLELHIGIVPCDRYILPGIIFEAKSLVDLNLCYCELKLQEFETIRCHNLKRLRLDMVFLDEVTFQKIMSRCPLIENLEIHLCDGLKTFIVTKLKKLKQFTVAFLDRGDVEVQAPILEDFVCWDSTPKGMDSESRKIHLFECPNLKSLRLREVCITDEFFFNFAQNFPHIEDLKIHDCTDLQIITISIKSVSSNLKSLWLSYVRITDEFFFNFGQNLPQLEELKIYRCNTPQRIDISSQSLKNISLKRDYNLERIKISSQSLKSIGLKWNNWLKEAIVDVPSIVLFEYVGRKFPEFSFTAPLNRWASEIDICSGLFDNSWFFKLKELLTKLMQSEISLKIRNSSNVCRYVNTEELINRFPKPVQVQELSLLCLDDELEKAALFLDTIFWTCRPKTITLYCDEFGSDKIYFPKLLYEMLIMGRNQKNCNLQKIKFWQQDLKAAKHEIYLEEARDGLKQPDYLDWEYFLKREEIEVSSWYLYFDLEWE